MAGLDKRTMPIGPLSALAVSQYQAVAAMRWRLFRNTLRSPQGAIELGARTVAYVFYGLMGLGMAAGFAFGAYAIAADEQWRILPVLFWVLFVLWQVVPVTLASFQEHFDLGALLRFPIGFGAFYLLHLIFGLVDASTIMGALCSLGIVAGITVVRPGLFGWAALGAGAFGVFNVLLVRAISAWMDRWLAQRRTREIVGAVFFLALLSLQLLNPAFRSAKHSHLSATSRAATMRWVGKAEGIQEWLPPGLAALQLQDVATSRPVPALEAVALLGFYVLAAGGALGMRLHADYRGENLGDAPGRKKAETRTRTWLIDGSGPVAAVVEKELRVLMRAIPLIYGLGAPLLMVFVLSGLFLRRGPAAGPPMSMSLLINLAYAMVGFAPLFYNNLGPEGAGVQIYFLAPTPIRTVILAKNLFHSLLFAVDAAVVCLVASLRLGRPEPAALAATAAWLLFALPVHLAVGNLFSLNMPYRMNLGRITRQRGSQTSALLSMLIQAGVLGIGAGVFALCSFFTTLWMAVPVLLVLAGAASMVWLGVLARVGDMANRRRESLMGTLARTE